MDFTIINITAIEPIPVRGGLITLPEDEYKNTTNVMVLLLINILTINGHQIHSLIGLAHDKGVTKK